METKNSFELTAQVIEEVSSIVIGQKSLIEAMMIGLLADGHLLVEGVPGLAKTTAIKTLSDSIDTSFSRIQFTPDLLPADLLGTQIYSSRNENFEIKKGPIFANMVLADEINRAPAKVQSALLEAMQEKQVSIGNESFNLDKTFLVMATQNPVDQEGTYTLPEAQLDRFMFKVEVGYPSVDDEVRVIKSVTSGSLPQVKKILTPEIINDIRGDVEGIFVDDKIYTYIAHLVDCTRNPENYQLSSLSSLISHGASPRAGLILLRRPKFERC